MSIRNIQRELPSPAPKPDPTEQFVAANLAHMRAMGVARLIDNGVPYADAVAFHRLARENVEWIKVGEWLGDRNLAQARFSHDAGFTKIAADYLLAASACYRFAQSALVFDTPEKKRIYRKVVDCFSEAMMLVEWEAEKLELPCRDGDLCGWLLRPPTVSNPPVVVIFGGADGWRESYYSAGLPLLHEGIAICLVDGPGQGESRIFHNLYITEELPADFAILVDHLKSHKALSCKVGVFGNSLGGTIAALLAAELETIDACCINGGSISPAGASEKFPRGLDKIAAMMGIEDRAAAQDFKTCLDLNDRVGGITCPLLVLHGDKDALFTTSSAQAIHDKASSEHKQMVLWDDGEHCVYTHAFARNAIIAEFFATYLL